MKNMLKGIYNELRYANDLKALELKEECMVNKDVLKHIISKYRPAKAQGCTCRFKKEKPKASPSKRIGVKTKMLNWKKKVEGS